MDPITVKFRFEKETPGTYRFTEEGDKADHKIGTLYVKKSAFAGGSRPDALAVALS